MKKASMYIVDKEDLEKMVTEEVWKVVDKLITDRVTAQCVKESVSSICPRIKPGDDSDLVNRMFNKEESDEAFELWAFGRSPGSYDKCLMRLWNERHGRLLTLEGGDSISDSLIKMRKVWKEHRGNTHLESEWIFTSEEKPKADVLVSLLVKTFDGSYSITYGYFSTYSNWFTPDCYENEAVIKWSYLPLLTCSEITRLTENI